jgi:diguanylate cyclase (GGDEF)-like protein
MGVVRSFVTVAFALLAMLVASPELARAAIELPPCNGRAAGAEAVPYGPRAILFDCGKQQPRYGAGDFFVRFAFAPVRSEPRDPLVLRLTSVWQDSAAIRFDYADGASETVVFTSKTASRYLGIGALFEIPVPPRDAPLAGIAIHTTGTANLRGIVLGPALVPQSDSNRLALILTALYAAFAGLSLALIVYNLALWAAMRHRLQLLYSAMVAAILLYAFTSSGAAMAVFPELANNDRLRLNYLLLSVAGLTAMQFVRHFFEAGILALWLKRAIDGLSIFAFLSALAFAAFAPAGIWFLDRVYFGAMGSLCLLVLPIVWSAWRNKSRHLWMFVIAWSAPVLISLLRMLHGFGFIPYSFWLDNGNLIALAIEALLSSFLITARLRELGRERDLARVGEQQARRLAATDPLTGLLNRRAFLEMAIGSADRWRLMLIDIDHFKSINDRCGHDTGDEVLRAIAAIIQSCRTPGSLAVRLGGEEFALLLPKAEMLECPPERVLQAIRKHAMPNGLGVTVSMGFADGTLASEEDWKHLYRLADAGLYRAKADGRDRASKAFDLRQAA